MKFSQWASLGLAALLSAAPVAAITNNFDFYPAAARNCLNQSAIDVGCTEGTRQKLNTCLCGNNGNFITNTAACMGTEGDPMSAINKTFATMKEACSESKTPVSVTLSQWMKAAKDAAAAATESTSAPAGATSTSSSSSITGSNHKSSGMSSGAKIGIGVGVGVGGVALIGALAAVFFFRRKAQKAEAANSVPVDPSKSQPPMSMYSGVAPTPSMSPAWTTTPSPGPQHGVSPQPWGSPQNAVPPYSAPGTDVSGMSTMQMSPAQQQQMPLMQYHQQQVPPVQQVHEMAYTPASPQGPVVVEMPGSVPQGQ